MKVSSFYAAYKIFYSRPKFSIERKSKIRRFFFFCSYCKNPFSTRLNSSNEVPAGENSIIYGFLFFCRDNACTSGQNIKHTTSRGSENVENFLPDNRVGAFGSVDVVFDFYDPCKFPTRKVLNTSISNSGRNLFRT